MPELPEVETIKRYLDLHLKGKIIKTIDAIEPKQFIGNPKDIIGAKITANNRKGKVLTIKLDNNLYLNVHLKMSGQLLYAENKNNATFENIIPKANTHTMPGSTTRIIIEFSDNSALFYNDLRKFGWIKVSNEPLVPKSADVLSDEFTYEYFKNAISKFNKPVKPLLMDQEILAGIGNIYANDAVYVARINPQKKAKTLTDAEIKKLYESIKLVIADGIKYKGSSSRDETYISPDGSKGNYQNFFRVYSREGEACPKCKGKITRIKQGGRSTFYCPNCQK